MGKLVRLIGSLIVYLCIATIVAQMVIVGFLSARGQLVPERMKQAAAALQGITLTASANAAGGQAGVDHEQPSFDDVLQARAMKSRQIEIREQSLKSGVEELALRQRQLKAEMEAYQRLKTSFETSLAELDDAERVRARDEVRLILESMDPKQAKDQILRMVDADEMDDVVLMLSAMNTSKKSKLVAEFKTEEEATTLEEILRLIKEGEPKTSLIDQTQQQLQPPSGTPPPQPRP